MAWKSLSHMRKVKSYPDYQLRQEKKSNNNNNDDKPSEMDKILKEFQDDPDRFSMNPAKVRY